jgi:hypothetical protein
VLLLYNAECRNVFIIMLNVGMLNVSMLHVVMLIVDRLNVVMLSVVMPNVVAPMTLKVTCFRARIFQGQTSKALARSQGRGGCTWVQCYKTFYARNLRIF